MLKEQQNNILKVLAYYKIENNIKETLSELNSTNKITEIMNIEGRFARNIILNLMKFFPMILKWKADPDNLLKNMINSLISFGNSMMYSTVLTELYNTQLNPYNILSS